jgi:hypothetical protein
MGSTMTSGMTVSAGWLNTNRIVSANAKEIRSRHAGPQALRLAMVRRLHQL